MPRNCTPICSASVDVSNIFSTLILTGITKFFMWWRSILDDMVVFIAKEV